MNQSLLHKAVTTAYLEALVVSINRYSTAVAAGDLFNASLQRNAILAYIEDTLVLLLRSEADTINRLSSSVQGDGLPNPHVGVADIAVLQAAVAANGLPKRIAQGLLQLGLTPSNVDAIRDSFLGATPTSLATDLSAVMRENPGGAGGLRGVRSGITDRTPDGAHNLCLRRHLRLRR